MGNWGQFNKTDMDVKTTFLVLKNETILRIGDAPEMVNVHWEKDINDLNKKVICPGVGCPLCNKGRKPENRFYVKVIDRADGQAYVMEIGKMVGGQVQKYSNDPNYGNPTKYDITIHKTGTGRDSKYTVNANPKKSDLTTSELELLSKIDMDALIKVTSIKDIKSMGLKVLPMEVVHSESEFTGDEEIKNMGYTVLLPMEAANNEQELIGDDEWDNLGN